MAFKKGQIVHILWHDAEVVGEWKEAGDLNDHSSTLCETVGFVVKAPTKKDPMYIVASTRSKSDGTYEFNAITKIPKTWVEKIEEVE